MNQIREEGVQVEIIKNGQGEVQIREITKEKVVYRAPPRPEQKTFAM
jgi:hypothetical protein